MRFSNILLVLNTRRPAQALALRRAAAFARTEGALLTVCEAVDWVLPEAPRHTTDGTTRILADTIRTDKIERLKKLVATSGAGDLDITVKLVVGKPHIEVARLVREDRHDLVIKPIAGHRATRFLSSVQDDREMIRGCPCPVWLMNVVEKDDNISLLTVLEMPAEGDVEAGLNQRIVDVSRSIALAESRPLHFVHAWQLPGAGHMRARCNPAADLEADRMLARESIRREIWLQNTVATPRPETGYAATDKIMPELHVLNGHANKVIPELAEELGAGLIVIGSALRSGQTGFMRQNTVEKMLLRSDCSFLVVKQPEPMPTRAPERRRTMQVG